MDTVPVQFRVELSADLAKRLRYREVEEVKQVTVLIRELIESAAGPAVQRTVEF